MSVEINGLNFSSKYDARILIITTTIGSGSIYDLFALGTHMGGAVILFVSSKKPLGVLWQLKDYSQIALLITSFYLMILTLSLDENAFPLGCFDIVEPYDALVHNKRCCG